MCGRYVINADPNQLQQAFELTTVPQFAPRFNIAPTQTAPVITNDSPREAVMYRWGLIPSWAKDASLGGKMINARSESVEEKPAFRTAFKRRRCIVPMTGFYEWRKLDDNSKQPLYIYRKDSPFMGVAGLWEVWKEPETGEEIRTYTILTTSANPFMQQFHDRMPVILKPEDYERWLMTGEKESSSLRDLLQPLDASALTAHEVSKAVNRVVVDMPNLILPIQ